MSDVNAKTAAGCYIQLKGNSILVNYSIFCLLCSYKESVIGFDSSTNLSYCNIFNNTARDCQFGILSFYWQDYYQIYIENCAIFNNGCETNLFGGTDAGRINIYLKNSFIDNCKVGGKASLFSYNLTNSYYEYDLPLFKRDMCKIYVFSLMYRMNRGYFLSFDLQEIPIFIIQNI